MTPRPGLVGQAAALLGELLRFSGPADQAVSRYFRAHRNFGREDRAFIAQTVYAVLRRKRSLAAAAASRQPRALVLAALVRVLGFSGRSMQGSLQEGEADLITKVKSFDFRQLPPAEQFDLPDWLWERLAAQNGAGEAQRIAQALLNPAPLDLRVNLAKLARDEALQRLRQDGFEGQATPHSPAGIRLKGKPSINQHPLFLDGSVEVQDEGSQLLAYLLAPRRGEMVADFCAGAGGKTLALAMLMRNTGRLYAMDVSAKRLSQMGPRAARAGISNVHPIVLEGENDLRARRLSGKLDRVLVDAPCSGFGTLRRNPDLKWRQHPDSVVELARKQSCILSAAAKLVKPGGRLVYATCSLLAEENEEVVAAFGQGAGEAFAELHCGELLAAQRISLECGPRLRLRSDLNGTDGFFAAAFERR